VTQRHGRGLQCCRGPAEGAAPAAGRRGPRGMGSSGSRRPRAAPEASGRGNSGSTLGRRAAELLFRLEQRERAADRGARERGRPAGSSNRFQWIGSGKIGSSGALKNENKKDNCEIKKRRRNPSNQNNSCEESYISKSSRIECQNT